jgi:hypothetical protein
MESSAILLQNVNPDQFKELITSVFKAQLEEFKKDFSISNPEELLTREQTCDLLQINLSTLHHWTIKGKINAYGIGSRRYYKKAELLNSLQPLKK